MPSITTNWSKHWHQIMMDVLWGSHDEILWKTLRGLADSVAQIWALSLSHTHTHTYTHVCISTMAGQDRQTRVCMRVYVSQYIPAVKWGNCTSTIPESWTILFFAKKHFAAGKSYQKFLTHFHIQLCIVVEHESVQFISWSAIIIKSRE